MLTALPKASTCNTTLGPPFMISIHLGFLRAYRTVSAKAVVPQTSQVSIGPRRDETRRLRTINTDRPSAAYTQLPVNDTSKVWALAFTDSDKPTNVWVADAGLGTRRKFLRFILGVHAHRIVIPFPFCFLRSLRDVNIYVNLDIRDAV